MAACRYSHPAQMVEVGRCMICYRSEAGGLVVLHPFVYSLLRLGRRGGSWANRAGLTRLLGRWWIHACLWLAIPRIVGQRWGAGVDHRVLLSAFYLNILRGFAILAVIVVNRCDGLALDGLRGDLLLDQERVYGRVIVVCVAMFRRFCLLCSAIRLQWNRCHIFLLKLDHSHICGRYQ